MKTDFYILEPASTLQAWQFTCRLIEKIHAQQPAIYIHVNSHDEALYLDQLLWTYREDSFLAHNIYNPADEFPPTIQIGYSDAPSHQQGTLINLASAIPAFYQQFASIVEIVFPDPHVQQLARERYRQYREKGIPLATNKTKANEL